MNAKEVEVHGKALTKSFQGEPSANVIKILNDLKKGVVATEDLLRSTRIGATVNKFKQHRDPEVAKVAAELVAKWRGDVKRAGGKGASTPKSANGTASPAPSAAGSQTPATGNQTPKPKAKHNVPPEKRNHKTDNVNCEATGITIRDNCVKLMYDGLAFMSEELPDEILKVAREVELAAFNVYQPETSSEYKNKMRSLYQNLKNKSNPQLRQRVLSGEVLPKRFVVMTHEEMKSEERRAEDARLEKENMDKAMAAQEEKSISSSLQCGKCGQKKVSYTQAQTRSADEPMTTFCECMNCGNRWKFS